MIPISFYNTLSHSVQAFKPLESPNVYMYNCGPTVYDYAHIGNFRAFVFADVVRRFLELVGYNVHQVMNLTDVGHMTEDQLADGGGEDKMQLAARRLKQAKKQGQAQVENPEDPYQVAQFFTDAFIKDAKSLGLKIADEYPKQMPLATQYVTQMQQMIQKLIDQQHAYVAPDGAVYYSVESFKDYGKLSGNTLDRLRGGAGGRVLDTHQSQKRHPADFLLWKPDTSHLMKWDSPWGVGYPGWHIECSAMATSLLGRDVIDIHTGGEDNIFPHHECEIAQTCGATGQKSFAEIWMHTRFLLVEGEKMSKSKGNFFTVRDLFEKGIDPAVVRYELLRSHYRSNMNFTTKGMEDAASAVTRLRKIHANLIKQANGKQATVNVANHDMVKAFAESLADDLNMSGAIGVLFTWLADIKEPSEIALAALEKVDQVLNILKTNLPEVKAHARDEISHLCKKIDDARAAKDYVSADTLRKQLNDAGYDVKNTSEGTVAQRRLA